MQHVREQGHAFILEIRLTPPRPNTTASPTPWCGL